MSSIYSYLEHQNADDLFELYKSSWCCMAVYQSLPSMARHIVMRFLCIRTPVAVSFIRCWYKDTRHVTRDLDAALAKLQRLYILGRPPGDTISALGLNGTEETTEALSINLIFAESLHAALASTEESPWQDITNALPPLRSPPSMKTIESVAGAKWNAILHFLIGTADAPMPEPSVIQLLVATGLVAPGPGAEGGMADGEAVVDQNGGVLTIDTDVRSKKRKHKVLSWAEIVEAGGGEVHVTRDGYGFLLRSTSMQLWTFLDEYVRTAPARDQKTTDILALLFELGFCRRGTGYSIAALTESQQKLLDDFSAFGLVYIPEDQALDLPPGESPEDYAELNTARFFPTYLAITLTQPDQDGSGAGAGAGAGQAGAGADGTGAEDMAVLGAGLDAATLASSAFADAASGGALQLIVESNFRIYGYTRAGLHTTLLALFASIEALMPNLVVATINRRSVMAAYDRGIRAEQIIGFLRAHLHPGMRARGLSVPENVAGQLVLWQRERHRIACRGAVLITGFVTVAQFRDAVAFAKSLQQRDDEDEEEQNPTGSPSEAGSTAGAGSTATASVQGSPQAADDSTAQGAGLDLKLHLPTPPMASGGLLWADEAKLVMVVRDGDYAEAVRAHIRGPAIKT